MANWIDTFKKELDTNTMKNPLDTMFPTLRKKLTGDNPPPIKPSPIKAKAKETTDVIGNDIKKVETTVKSWLPIIIIILLVFMFGKK